MTDFNPVFDVDPNGENFIFEVNTNESGGTVDHADTTNRDAADSHPIGAVTGLQDALDAAGGVTSYPVSSSADLTTANAAIASADAVTEHRVNVYGVSVLAEEGTSNTYDSKIVSYQGVYNSATRPGIEYANGVGHVVANAELNYITLDLSLVGTTGSIKVPQEFSGAVNICDCTIDSSATGRVFLENQYGGNLTAFVKGTNISGNNISPMFFNSKTNWAVGDILRTVVCIDKCDTTGFIVGLDDNNDADASTITIVHVADSTIAPGAFGVKNSAGAELIVYHDGSVPAASQVPPAGWSAATFVEVAASGGDSGDSYVTILKADGDSVVVGDAGKLAVVATGATITLPAVATLGVGWSIYVRGKDATIKPASGDTTTSVWASGYGSGVTIIERETTVKITYRGSNLFDVVAHAGGPVHVEGLKCLLECAEQILLVPSLTDAIAPDRAGRNLLQTYGALTTAVSTDLHPSVYEFDGINDYIKSSSASDDFNIFDSLTTDYTVRVRFNSTATVDNYVFSLAGSLTYLQLYRDAVGGLYTLVRIDNVTYLSNESSGITIGSGIYVDCVFVKKGDVIAWYVDGEQVTHDVIAHTSAAPATAHIGHREDGYGPLTGRVSEFFVVAQNIYTAAPNVGLTDTIVMSDAPASLVMGV